MANVTVSGEEILKSLTSHLCHLEACREFIDEFQRQGYEPRVLEWTKQNSSLNSYERLVAQFKCYETTKIGGPGVKTTVQVVLENIEQLRTAKKLIAYLQLEVGFYGRVLPDAMVSQLHRLNGFDDSE
jgi:hypothetical protein